VDDDGDGFLVSLEQIRYPAHVADVDVVVLVASDVGNQIVARFFGGSFRAKKFCAHVVVDADDARAVFGETPDCLRSD